jgi:ribonuclease BN (tRNA processing enzyme)
MLFEASPTTLPALRELKMRLEDVKYLFISHFHADHCFGLPFLFLDHYFVTKRKTPLTIIGPKGIERLSRELVDKGFCGTRQRFSNNFPVRFLEVRPNRRYELEGFGLVAYQMSHGDMDCLGFCLDYKGRWIAYSGDTGPCPELTNMLAMADLAVVEMSSIDGDFASNLNLSDVLELRKGMRPDARMVLTHLPAITQKDARRLLDNPYGTIDLAEDMERFEFGL